MPQRHRSTEDRAHDVLAAEAFAVPGPDPSLTHGPVVLPEDPSGIAEPHDILAAEEFAMPAGRASGDSDSFARHARRNGPLLLGLAFAVVVAVRRRRRRRRSRPR
jgi:hypothetical protein